MAAINNNLLVTLSKLTGGGEPGKFVTGDPDLKR